MPTIKSKRSMTGRLNCAAWRSARPMAGRMLRMIPPSIASTRRAFLCANLSGDEVGPTAAPVGGSLSLPFLDGPRSAAEQTLQEGHGPDHDPLVSPTAGVRPKTGRGRDSLKIKRGIGLTIGGYRDMQMRGSDGLAVPAQYLSPTGPLPPLRRARNRSTQAEQTHDLGTGSGRQITPTTKRVNTGRRRIDDRSSLVSRRRRDNLWLQVASRHRSAARRCAIERRLAYGSALRGADPSPWSRP